MDAECVTAGFATIRLTVQTALNVREISLDVPPSGTVEQVVDEVTIVVIGLQPDALAGVVIDPINYVVGLQVLQTGSIEIPQ